MMPNELTKYTPEEFLEEEEECCSLVETVSHEINFIKQHQANEEALKTQIKLLQNELKALQAERESAERDLIDTMNLHGAKSLKYFDLRFSVRDNPGRIVIEDAALIPQEFVRDVTERQIDKRAIKQFYKDTGLLPPGTKFEVTQSISIRDSSEANDE